MWGMWFNVFPFPFCLTSDQISGLDCEGPNRPSARSTLTDLWRPSYNVLGTVASPDRAADGEIETWLSRWKLKCSL